MSNSSNSAGGGIGFGGMLAILFIGLKLTGYITWPWLWVLSPIWIPFAILFVVLGLFLIGWIFTAIVVAGVAATTVKKSKKVK